MKTLIVAAIRCSLTFTVVTAPLFCIRPAQAYVVTMDQVGSDVVVTGSGAINLTGLTPFGLGGIGLTPGILPDSGLIAMAPGTPVKLDNYIGFIGPRRFGRGQVLFHPDTSSGDAFVLEAAGPFFQGEMVVPAGYVSGAPLSGSMTFNDATFASLGVTPGTYIWRWGTGLENQNFTLIIGGVGVPDGGTTVSLLGFGLLGLVALRRKLGC